MPKLDGTATLAHVGEIPLDGSSDAPANGVGTVSRMKTPLK